MLACLSCLLPFRLAQGEVISGVVSNWAESSERVTIGDGANHVSMWWSWNTAHRGFFYGSAYDHGSNVAFSPQISDVSQIANLSEFGFSSYVIGPLCDATCARNGVGDIVLWRNNATGHYGALRVENIRTADATQSRPAGYLSGTWWFQTDGSSNFSNSSISPFSVRRPNPIAHPEPGAPYSATSVVSFDSIRFNIDTKIAVKGGDGAAELLELWEAAIEAAWGGFTVVDQGVTYGVRVGLDFVSEGSPADYEINIDDSLFCRWTVGNWCTGFGRYFGDAARAGFNHEYLHQRAAAHEFGHILGVYDEYEGGANQPGLDPDSLCTRDSLGLPTGLLCDGIMGDFVRGEIVDRYFEGILDFLRTQTGIPSLVMGSLPGSGTLAVPEVGDSFVALEEGKVSTPSTLMLLVLSAACSIACTRRVGRSKSRQSNTGSPARCAA